MILLVYGEPLGQERVNALIPTARKQLDKLKLYNSAKEDIKVETGLEYGLFWLKQLDRFPTISVHP